MPRRPSCGSSTVRACRRSRPPSAGTLPSVLFSTASWTTTAGRRAKPLRFRNAVGKTLREKSTGVVDEAGDQEYGTEAWFAYDKDFLYVALRCKHPADRYVAPVTRRKRDEDLQAFDRVSLLLDLDRDYSTYFHLEIDQRGCVYEDCWGDKSWNPKWFVAVRSEPTCWQAEVAIPLFELTSDAVTPGRAWACNLCRDSAGPRRASLEPAGRRPAAPGGDGPAALHARPAARGDGRGAEAESPRCRRPCRRRSHNGKDTRHTRSIRMTARPNLFDRNGRRRACRG